MDKEKNIFKILDMYYNEEMSQDKIAKIMGISRPAVSRLIKKAKDDGLVKVVINYPVGSSIELEKKLQEKYGLKEAIVSVKDDNATVEYGVFTAGAEFMKRNITDNMTVGITWSRSIKCVVERFQNIWDKSCSNVSVVSFIGSSGNPDYSDEEFMMTYSNMIAYKLGEILRAKTLHMFAPMKVSSEEIRKIFENESQIASVLEKAKHSDIAIIGIGDVSKDSSIVRAGIMTEGEMETLRNLGGEGEVISRIFDKNGKDIDCELNRRTVGLEIDDLKKVPIRVGISYGENKVSAIRSAIVGEIINVLITDDNTAIELLKD